MDLLPIDQLILAASVMILFFLTVVGRAAVLLSSIS